jgi:hypothetical protein
MRRWVLVCAALVAAGCTSSASHPAATSPQPFSQVVTTSTDSVQHYLDQVNALCDALLPKVLAATHGGHDGPYPVRVYFAEEPAHAKARREFDVALAKVAVPAGAETQHAALNDYLRFANRIDAARAGAARKGQHAFDKEIEHERTVDLNSPIIAARDAAGFADSCTAR